MSKQKAIKIYHGFGHKHDLVVFGHVFRQLPKYAASPSRNPVVNLFRLLRLFFIKPVAEAPLQLTWDHQGLNGKSEFDGFFRFEWVSRKETPAGWHPVVVKSDTAIGRGEVFVPHLTQYAFISDIDDTIMVSHSATIGKRLKELLFKNPQSRDVFPNVAEHYKLLAKAHTTEEAPNPFFYVSSSEWNLYDYLQEVFLHKQLPQGAFLLNQAKRWFELWKTGKTKHEGKLLRILRIFEVFPLQKFILLGDNSQSDPAIYSKLAEKYGDRIYAIYIRNVSKENEGATKALLASLHSRNIHTLLFKDSSEAIAHSQQIGLITIT